MLYSLTKKITLWFFFQLIGVISALSLPGNETDRLSLLEFKAKIESDPLGILESWNESTEVCSWPGITCGNSSHRVIALDLPNLQLKGQLSSHIGNLSFLERLNLANNSFGPEIPSEIGRLFKLRILNFRNNSFSGEIPANISGCSSLQYLFLLLNDLSGRIPAEIGLLSKLETLQFSSNKLVGEIPASIGNLSLLSQLYLFENHLQGPIPSSLSQLKRVKIFSVAANNLTGTVPPSIYNLSSIEVFGIHVNQLEGVLPSNLGLTLPNLQYFSVFSNYFSGSIPSTLSNASNLVVIQIQYNNFTGKVPSFKSSLNLTNLGLSYNNLGYAKDGDLNFISDLVNCSKFESLGFVENNLGGEIPEAIGNMTSTFLREMAFGRNKIIGNIPTGIGNLVSLQGLGLEENLLTGPIPITIGKLKKIVAFTLHGNELSGNIPHTIGNLTSLIRLSLGRNNIQGNIPPSFGECRNLQVLTLPQNNISGTIPSQLMSLSSLTQYLDLSRNQITGSIPVEVGRLVNLGGLDISENKLSGEIPEALSSCTSMESLYLQGNFLQGSIPDSLSTLRGLQVIDFSRNNLSGRIPTYFEDLRGLQYLNLSFNELEGQVPLQGIFKNASAFSIIGNARLCGGLPELKLPVCTSNSNKKEKLPAWTKLVIIISCAIAGLSIITFLVVFAFCSRKRRKPNVDSSMGISLPRVSYEDLSKATDGFSSENLIGVGSFGSVYKGTLNQERRVAVKVLNLHVSRALKSFIDECESLGTVRHRNLVKILTICSSIDLHGNDFKAIVYEFMENGNLDELLHLHSEQAGKPRLNLIQRVNIAINVASALDYLHNHCSETIAHCDIKPSNILLDGHMVAHVGDFGLAKLLGSVLSRTSYQTSSIGVRGTVGYIPPEYATGSEVSTLGDIYSYGILLLEMFTGKRPTNSMFKDDFNLHKFASMALPDRVSEIVDPMLLAAKEEEEEQETENEAKTSEKAILGCDVEIKIVHSCLKSIIEVGVICSSTFPGDRRNMNDVAAALCQIRDTLNT